jgi:hypothetical protein
MAFMAGGNDFALIPPLKLAEAHLSNLRDIRAGE